MDVPFSDVWDSILSNLDPLEELVTPLDSSPPPPLPPPVTRQGHVHSISTHSKRAGAALRGQCQAIPPEDTATWFPLGDAMAVGQMSVTVWASDISVSYSSNRARGEKKGVFLDRSDPGRIKMRKSPTLTRTWNSPACPIAFVCTQRPGLSVEILSIYCTMPRAPRRNVDLSAARGVVRRRARDSEFEMAFARTHIQGVAVEWFLSLRFDDCHCVEFHIPTCTSDFLTHQSPLPETLLTFVTDPHSRLVSKKIHIVTLSQPPDHYIRLYDLGKYHLYIDPHVRVRSGQVYPSVVNVGRGKAYAISALDVHDVQSPDACPGVSMCIVGRGDVRVKISVASFSTRGSSHGVGYLKSASETEFMVAMSPLCTLNLNLKIRNDTWSLEMDSAPTAINAAPLAIETHGQPPIAYECALPTMVLLGHSPAGSTVPMSMDIENVQQPHQLNIEVANDHGTVECRAQPSILKWTRVSRSKVEAMVLIPSYQELFLESVVAGVHRLAIDFLAGPDVRIVMRGMLLIST